MTLQQAYQFVHNLSGYCVSQCTWEHNFENGYKGELTLHIWIKPTALLKFCKLLGQTAFDDGDICDTSLCSTGDICISNFDEVLEYYGIDAEEVEPKPKE